MRFLNILKERARALKTEADVLLIAYRDNRTPFFAKVLIWLTVGYLLSPIDLIPDFIPVIGLLDDLIIVPLLIKASISLLPEVVLSDARECLRTGAGRYKKTNWAAGACIILLWLLILIWGYIKIRHRFNI